MGCRDGRQHSEECRVHRSHLGPAVSAVVLLKIVCVLQSLDAVGVAAQPGSLVRTGPASLVRREAREHAAGDSRHVLTASSRRPAARFFAARASKRREPDRGSGGRLLQGGLGDGFAALRSRTRGDDHVIDNYGTGASVSRMVNEKSSCQGACSDGWDDDMVDTLPDGNKIHGMFSGNSSSAPSIKKTIATNATHVMVRVSMIFWSMGHWNNGEKGFLKINGVEEWTKARDSPTECKDWSLCGKKPVNANLPTCCQVVSRSINHNGTAALVEIGSNIDEGSANESFAVSDFLFDVISEKT